MKTKVTLTGEGYHYGKSCNNDLQGHRDKKGSKRPLDYPSETGGE